MAMSNNKRLTLQQHSILLHPLM